MNFGSMSLTQRYALIVGVVVIAVVVFLIANGTFEIGGGGDGSDDGNGDSLALDQSTDQGADASDGERWERGEAVVSADGGTGVEGEVVGPTGLLVMNQAFQFGDLRMAVTEIRLGDRVGPENGEVEALERFATVHLSARSTGLAALELAGRLLLVDAQGRGFEPNAVATAAAERATADRVNALTVALQPGITTDLIVVFDIAEEANDFRLRISDGFVEVALER